VLVRAELDQPAVAHGVLGGDGLQYRLVLYVERAREEPAGDELLGEDGLELEKGTNGDYQHQRRLLLINSIV